MKIFLSSKKPLLFTEGASYNDVICFEGLIIFLSTPSRGGRQCRWCSQLHYTRIHNICWIFFRLSKCVGCIKPSETSLSHIGICGVALRRVSVTIGLYSVRLLRMGATQLKRRHKTHPVKASSSPQTYCRYRGANCYNNNIAGGVSWD